MSESSDANLSRVVKLNGSNFHEWRADMEALLQLKDVWTQMNEERPPASQVEELKVWKRAQNHAKSLIHLSCSTDAKHLISAAQTAIEAWEILGEFYASTDITNVIRMEDVFGKARKSPHQTMAQWIGHVRSLANQCRAVGVDLPQARIAHRMINGLGPEYESTRAALRARPGALTVDMVAQQLLAAETDKMEDAGTAVKTPVVIPQMAYQSNARQFNPGTLHGPTATAMSALTPDHFCNPSCICQQVSVDPVGTVLHPGAMRTSAVPNQYRHNPYPRLPRSTIQCTFCGENGHVDTTCWTKFPHLKPRWMLDKEEWKRQRRPPTRPEMTPSTPTPTLQVPSTQPSMTAHSVQSYQPTPQSSVHTSPPHDYQTAYQNAAFSGTYNPDEFIGPSSSSVDKHATAHISIGVQDFSNLNGKPIFEKEYARSVLQEPFLISGKVEGEVGSGDEPGMWLVDTGASNHYSPFKHLFLNLTPCLPPVEILTGNGWVVSNFHGTIPLVIKVENEIIHINLENVLYVPTLQTKVNLFSVVVLADRGYYATFGPTSVQFRLDGKLLASGTKVGKSWWLDADLRSHEICLSTADKGQRLPNTLQVWHQRLAHLNKRDISRLQSMADGLTIGTPLVPNSMQCAGCLVGKDHRQISRIPRQRPTKHLEIVFTDICGPMRVPGLLGGYLYFVVFVDGFSRFTWLFCLKKKDECRIAFDKWSAIQERFTGNMIIVLFSDNEPSLLQTEFQGLLAKRGIQHYTTQTYSSEMNGPAETAIKTLVQRASAMLWTAKMPEGFWPEALRATAYIKNRCPHKTIGKTPYEAWFGSKPDLGHLRIFGSRCYAHVEKANRTKWDSHTVEGILIGYYASEGLYAIYDVNKRMVVKKRDVTFFEHIIGHPSMSQWGLSPGFNILGEVVTLIDGDVPDLVDEVETDVFDFDPQTVKPTAENFLALLMNDLQIDAVAKGSIDTAVTDTMDSSEFVFTTEESVFVPVMSMVQHISLSFVHQAIREWGLNKGEKPTLKKARMKDQEPSLVTGTLPGGKMGVLEKYEEMYKVLLTEYGQSERDLSEAVIESDPQTWKQAMQSSNGSFWLRAAWDEMKSITTMATFKFVDDLPPGRRALPTKWVWTSKRGADGKVEKFKARWVARGDRQRKGVDYNETFAPVASLTTTRIILTLAAYFDMEIDQVDVVSAFLNGPIDTQIFLRQPEGFSIGRGYCELNKSLYGLCQAARVWYMVLDNALQEIGYKRLDADLAVWKIPHQNQYLVAHVDDMLLIGTRDQITDSINFLKLKFNMKILGPASIFIGLQITRDRANRVIWLDQEKYAKEMLSTYEMDECNSVSTPLTPGEKLIKASNIVSDNLKRLYQAIVGSLAYLMNCTRPDLAFAVTKLAQFASAPATEHLQAAKHVLRYVKGSTMTRLKMGSSESTFRLTGYFDASWADDVNDSRSTFGYVVLYGNTPLLWKSKKHRTISLSTTDAEYIAATELTREICYIQNLLMGLQLPDNIPVTLYGDNFNANALANGTTTNSRTRHIDLRQRYVTGMALEGIIKVEKISTEDQVADMFTKALPSHTLKRHSLKVGMIFNDFTCTICTLVFPSNNTLHEHLRQMHNEGLLSKAGEASIQTRDTELGKRKRE